jgi:HK97 family phage prohead protease
MPLKSEFKTIYEGMLTKYGAELGVKAFNSWAEKKGIDPYVKDQYFSFEGKALTFNTDQVAIEHKGEDYYVTGYISTSDLDAVNDIVTKECLQDMVEQLKTRNIKLDVEHESYKQDTTIIPIGKIVDARLDEKGIWVKAVVNQHTSRFKEIWNSLKSGFIDAFSITFRAKQAIEKTIDDLGTTARLLYKVDLLNVALTGNPCNREAKIMEVFSKSLDSINEDKMVKETDKEPVKDEEEVAESTQTGEEETEAKETPNVEVVDTKSMADLLTEIKSLKEEVLGLKEQTDQKEALDEEINSLKATIVEIKEKMAKPMWKAGVEDKSVVDKIVNGKDTDFLSKI